MTDDYVSESQINTKRRRMLNRNWGTELWDQFDNVAKYSEKSIQFCEKYESFLKDRCTIEDEYAKSLKKLTKTYTPKLKEQEEFHNKFTYTIAFHSTLKELQDLASQHELIAENLRECSIKHIQIIIKECREQRKKCLEDYNKIKRQLDKQHELLIKSLRKYEECHESARRAKDSYEKAHEDLDLSRAQLEKARDTMTFKTKICDDTHTNYSSQVCLYNEIQRLYYERQLPNILSDLQQLDKKRLDELKHVFLQSIQSHTQVLPRIQTCLDEMFKQTEELNSYTDAQVVIDEYKSGYAIPDDEQVIHLQSILQNEHEQQIYQEFTRSSTLRSTNNSIATIYTLGNGSNHMNGTQTLMATPGMNPRKSGSTTSTIKKIFGSSTQRKPPNTNFEIINTPYHTLPPAQRLKKFQEQILNCKNKLEQNQKAKEGLIKMKVVFQENPKFGDEQNVTQQLVSIDETIEKLIDEIKRFESYIIEISHLDSSSQLSLNYNSDHPTSTPLQNRNLFYFRQHHCKFMNFNRRWSTTVCSSDNPEGLTLSQSNNAISSNDQSMVTSSNEFQRLPSITSMTLDQTDTTTNNEQNESFEDDDHSTVVDHNDNRQLNEGNFRKGYVLYEFSGHDNQYANAASISAGEYVDILEDDHGDGWTRIRKLDGSTGYVPSAYLRIDHRQIESDRY